MFTMRLDLSLCGMWYCKALVLLVGVLLCRVLTLPRAYCVICPMCAAACSISGGVFCAAVCCHCLFATSLLGKVIGSPKLGWVVVILLVGWGIGRGCVVGLFLWLLKFQQGIKDLVGGYVGIVI